MTVQTIHILDKSYQINCPEEQKQELVSSAAFLDKKMREIQRSGKIVGLERIAIMAALNICHEFLAMKKDHVKATAQQAIDQDTLKQLEAIQEKIQSALDKNRLSA